MLSGGFPGGLRAQNECSKKFGKKCFLTLVPRVLGAPSSIIVRNRTPSGARLVRKVFWDDDLALFSSDKIRAKSARILSAAITRMTLLPAGVRIESPAGVRVPHDDFHSGVGYVRLG